MHSNNLRKTKNPIFNIGTEKKKNYCCREKLNDYLCRQYIVDKILHDISGGTDYYVSSESRSMPSDYSYGISKTMTMQTDQGSSAYNTWLTK